MGVEGDLHVGDEPMETTPLGEPSKPSTGMEKSVALQILQYQNSKWIEDLPPMWSQGG